MDKIYISCQGAAILNLFLNLSNKNIKKIAKISTVQDFLFKYKNIWFYTKDKYKTLRKVNYSNLRKCIYFWVNLLKKSILKIKYSTKGNAAQCGSVLRTRPTEVWSRGASVALQLDASSGCCHLKCCRYISAGEALQNAAIWGVLS